MKMLQYTVKRLIIMLFTLFIIATATFFLLAATPGDALSARVEKLPDSVAQRMYARCCWASPWVWHWVCWRR